MSMLKIRQALESHLYALDNTFPTAWENDSFTPTTGIPFQAVNLLPAPVENATIGATSTLVKESGILQVMLHYPPDSRSKNVLTKAEEIRDHFFRGLSLSKDGVDVRIGGTPSVGTALTGADWHRVPVSIPYFAHIYR